MRLLAFASLIIVSTASHAWAGVVAVPEPASLTLLALGIGGVGLMKFRHRK